jgi:hypothetical protein
MDVVNEIEVLENDVIDVEKKCSKVSCVAVYEAIMATFKLIYDVIFMCCKKRD